jgi:hypothetical protein
MTYVYIILGIVIYLLFVRWFCSIICPSYSEEEEDFIMPAQCNKLEYECSKRDYSGICKEKDCYLLRNLCDSCTKECPICDAEVSDVKYGVGVGNDNIIECKKWEEDTLWDDIKTH